MGDDGAGRRAHWDRVYGARAPHEVTWYQPGLRGSLDMIDGLGLAPGARVVDVGGGASTLARDLLDRGLAVTVLDVSPAALDHARAALGPRAGDVTWIAADVTAWEPEQRYDLWHDRAVFHFLTAAADRAAYAAAARRAVAPGGALVLATFALNGPETCSGLPVVRYDGAALVRALGDGFALVRETREAHVTPRGGTQPFCRVLLRRTG
ncbi:MAG: class I SAM-dependent methyltransferase [Hyphomicrobiales bacterium]|nr:class I SAM-dependent methyltransferase [Hyphomicrobiales bacterium]MCP5371276.1 class I SAM-dependent methyltransferase [Hyphomicrobiales bacterium]